MEAPHLRDLQERYGDAGLRIVGVNAWDEPDKKVRDFVEDQKLPYIVLLNGHQVFKERYGGAVIPHGFLLDREGKVVHSFRGWSEAEHKTLESEIRKLLDK